MKALLTFTIFLSLIIEAWPKNLSTPDFQLTHPDEWKVEYSEDPPKWILTGKNNTSKFTLSSLRFPKGKNTELLAKVWLGLRMSAERKIMEEQGREVKLSKSLKKTDIGYQVEYWGVDSEGRAFRFWAVVGSSKIVNIYAEDIGGDAAFIEKQLLNLHKTIKL